MTPAIKQELYDLCQDYIRKRIDASRTAIDAAQRSANEETKSSSGDKYETGRAMAQLEIEKNTAQYAEALKLKNSLDRIRIDLSAETVQPGSLVLTDQGVFFIAISLGKVVIAKESYLVIAPASPLGLRLIGARPGDRVDFRDKTYVVKQLI